jgi:hypothetical protein
METYGISDYLDYFLLETVPVPSCSLLIKCLNDVKEQNPS